MMTICGASKEINKLKDKVKYLVSYYMSHRTTNTSLTCYARLANAGAHQVARCV